MGKPQKTRGEHIPTLDGLRGLALLLVVIHHSAFAPATTLWPGLAGRLYFTVAAVGWAGVDLFFVLSGFLITGILLDSRAGPHYFRNFYVRRTLRIFPLYYCVLILIFGLGPLLLPADSAGDDSSAWLWVYGTNIGQALKGGYLFPSRWFEINHFWSLAVEEQFYLVWPLVVYFLGRQGLRRTCVGCMVGAILLRFVLAISGASHQAVYYLPFCRVDTLAAGAWLAIAVRDDDGVAALMRPARWTALVSGGILLCVVVGVFQGRFEWVTSLFMQTIGLSLLWAFFGAILALVLPGGSPCLATRLCSFSALQWLSKYSYGAYVFHVLCYPILLPIVIRNAGTEDVFELTLLYLVVMSGFAMSLAWLSWNFFEQPILKLKRFFPMG
jgi:peptidoglycan/LPS O-acetylase OafA/YrhL